MLMLLLLLLMLMSDPRRVSLNCRCKVQVLHLAPSPEHLISDPEAAQQRSQEGHIRKKHIANTNTRGSGKPPSGRRCLLLVAPHSETTCLDLAGFIEM